MKLTNLRIQNFRSCREVSLEIENMHALVGANNAGKSSVLRALDFLFNPSARSLNEESFWNKDTSLEIRVEAIFTDLTDKEQAAFAAYLKADETFHTARSARMGIKNDESESDLDQDEDKIGIGQHYKKNVPEPEWLQESMRGYTSRGVGTSLFPIRLFCQPEIIIHTLRKAPLESETAKVLTHKTLHKNPLLKVPEGCPTPDPAPSSSQRS